MARVELNSALRKLRGKVDGYVYRNYRGRTVAQRMPVFTLPWSAAQDRHRDTFGNGAAYARHVRSDPALRSLYAERGKTWQLNFWQTALRDYFNAPVVHELTRDAGGRCVVNALDDFEVVRVTWAAHDANGTLLAEGEATGPHTWSFNLTAPTATRFTITAYDRPGNKAEKTFPL